MRCCTVCKAEKSLSEFSWNRQRKRHYSQCKDCKNTEHRNRRARIEAELAGTLKEKSCIRCKLTLPIEEFAWKEPQAKGRSRACNSCASPDGTKRCGRCQQIKPKVDFKFRDDWGVWHSFCRACEAEYNAEWHRAKLGIRPEEYAALQAEQNRRCAICGIQETLRVDHDHSCCPGKQGCGKCLRGLLCNACNLGIGQLGDNPATLRKAAEYIEKWMALRPPLELFSVEEVSGAAVLRR